MNLYRRDKRLIALLMAVVFLVSCCISNSYVSAQADPGRDAPQKGDLPAASIAYSNVVNSTTGYAPFKVTLDGTRSSAPQGKSIVSYEWDFGDGQTGSGKVVTHTFTEGKFTVKLTVTDDSGNSNSASQVFDVLPAGYPNLYLYLPFDKDAADASGKNMAVVSGEKTRFEKTASGRAIRFDNTGSRGISVSHSHWLDGLDEMTIAFMAKKDSKNTAAAVIQKYGVYRVSLTASGFSAAIHTDKETKTISAEKAVNDTEWHHYAITYDGSVIKAWVDGIECARIKCSGKIKRDAGQAVIIGGNPRESSFNGLMDEIRIYDRALDRDDIKHIMRGDHVGYRLTIVAVNGYVTVSPKKDQYMPGETVELFTRPAPGYSFKSWEGDLSGNRLRETIVMDGNKAAAAVFDTWTPPIGIPAPDFGIFETYRMYDDPLKRNPGLTYHKNAEGGYYTHYVDNTHPNAADKDNPFGTADKPRLTLPDASTVLPGSVVEFHGGPYTLKYTIYRADGTPDMPIFIRGYSQTDRVALNGGDLYLNSSWLIMENFRRTDKGICVRTLEGRKAHHVCVRNCDTAGLSALSWDGGTSEDVVFYGNYNNSNSFDPDAGEFKEKDGGGIGINLGSNRVWIVDNHITRAGGDASGAGHAAKYTARNYYIGRNIMHTCGENAVDIKEVDTVIVSQNMMYDFQGWSTGSDGTAVVLHYGPDHSPKNVWLLCNEIFNCTDTGIQVGGGQAYPVYIIGNIIHDIHNENGTARAFVTWNCREVYLVNNVIYNTDNGVNWQTPIQEAKLVFNNNMISNVSDAGYALRVTETSQMQRAEIGANLFWQPGGSAGIIWGGRTYNVDQFVKTTGKGTGSIEADPMFVSPRTGDFRLKPGSPAIDKGKADDVYKTFQKLFKRDIRRDPDGTLRPLGSGWDMGAYEYDPGDDATNTSLKNPPDAPGGGAGGVMPPAAGGSGSGSGGGGIGGGGSGSNGGGNTGGGSSGGSNGGGTVVPVLVSIAITSPPSKLTYSLVENLDLAGLVVTGTYSDSTTKTELVTMSNISGFGSSTAGDKRVTVTIGGKTASFVVKVVAAESRVLPSRNTYYIRAGGSGAEDGSDWSNALSELPDVLERGATYYIASGTYQAYRFDDPEQGTEYITIKKATVNDHGTDIGWKNGYDNGPALFTADGGPVFDFSTGYYIIDGQTGQKDKGHGIKLKNTKNAAPHQGGSCMRIPNGAQVRHLTLRHVEMEDAGWAGSVAEPPALSRTIYAVGTASHITFQYCYIHESGQEWMLFASPGKDFLVEHCYFKNGGSGSSDHHSVGIWFRGVQENMNIHIRYNTFENFARTGGTGYITLGWRGDPDTPTYSSGYYIYGNVFKETSPLAGPSRAIGSNGANGGPFLSDVKICNNTFYNMQNNSSNITLANPGTGNLAANNIWYGCSKKPSVNIESKNNILNDLSYDPFMDTAGGNFWLSRALPGGMVLDEPFNMDMDGAVRGSDGEWDIGAFEYEKTRETRPRTESNTLVVPDGSRLRGGTFWLYGWISSKTTWALSDAPWDAIRENKLNAIRVQTCQ